MSLLPFLETASACSGNCPNAGIKPGKGRDVDMGRVGLRVRAPLLQRIQSFAVLHF